LFILPYEFYDLSKTDVTNKFGRSELSEEIFGLDEKIWGGPFLSSYGLHLIYVINKKQAELIEFEEVKSEIKDILIKEKRKAAKNRIVLELKKKYVITYTEDLQTFADSIKLTLKEF
jgi:parvulin-like peptidyl-prolyl isomerase